VVAQQNLPFAIHQVEHPHTQPHDGGLPMYGLRRLLHHTQLNDSPHTVPLLDGIHRNIAPWISLVESRATPLPAPRITTPAHKLNEPPLPFFRKILKVVLSSAKLTHANSMAFFPPLGHAKSRLAEKFIVYWTTMEGPLSKTMKRGADIRSRH
jgi:hypothetical protein